MAASPYRRCRTLCAALLAALTLAAAGARGESLRAVYPQGQSDIEGAYYIKLLELALKDSDAALRPWDQPMEKGRALQELARGKHIDVVWAVTNRERERNFLPVRIPLDMGLSGWRVGVIRQEDSAKFAALPNLESLRRYTAGQGYDWADTAVLRANGITVRTGANTSTLYLMLETRRFDDYPRSVLEVWRELRDQPAKGFAVAPGWVLHYPTAVYFFVNRNNRALAAAIEAGLQTARRNGSFHRLFQQYNADSLKNADLAHRKIFELDNPNLPAATPLQQKDLWYRPEPHAGGD